MKRRDLIKSLAILPVAGSFPSAGSFLIASATGTVNLPPQDDMPALHRNAFVMDGHTHVMTRELVTGSDIGQRYPNGNVDLPRAKEGGVDAMFFSVYTPENYYPGRFEVKNAFRVVQLALDQIKKNNNVIELALTASEIERINKKGKIAAFLDLEGGFDLDGDLNILRALYNLGLRSAQLSAHNTTNAFADSVAGTRKWGGINDLGKTVIAEMNKLGMLINVAHASDEAMIQAINASRDPVIYSHGGFRALVNQPRCISDENAKALAAKGGVIGIHFGSLFNSPKYNEMLQSRRNAILQNMPPPNTQPRPVPAQPPIPGPRPIQTIEDIDMILARQVPLSFKGTIPDEYWMHTDQLAKVIDYGVNLVGEDHIALGSDFDGGAELPQEIKDISDYPEMTKAMMKIGYSEKRIRKILGLNWLRVIREVTEG